jgi:hypothetical protein
MGTATSTAGSQVYALSAVGGTVANLTSTQIIANIDIVANFQCLHWQSRARIVGLIGADMALLAGKEVTNGGMQCAFIDHSRSSTWLMVLSLFLYCVGYEEAAAQGLVAGINAARVAKGTPTVDFPRESSYIGTLVDDLITKVRSDFLDNSPAHTD